MKTRMILAVIMVAAGAVNAMGEVVKEIDASINDYVVFVFNAANPGTAFVALGQGRTVEKMKVETAYGMITKNGKPAMARVSDRKIKEIRGAKGTAESHTLIVKVSAAQYDSVKKIVEKWIAKESHPLPPKVTSTDFVVEVISAVGLKMPYRTGLGIPNPIVFYEDLSKVNR